MQENELILLSIVGIRNTSDCYLNINNGESVRCSIDLVAKYYLKKGMPISDQLMKSILQDQRLINVKKAAYRYSTYKPRTFYQVQDKLKQLGYENHEIELGVDFLVQFNLLDDYSYAKNYIRNRAKAKNFGKNRIIIELRKLRINDDIIDSVLIEEYDENSTYYDALSAFQKKMRMLTEKPIEKQKRSVTNYLFRRGFNWNLISKIINDNFENVNNNNDFDI
jgi:regulatory protein